MSHPKSRTLGKPSQSLATQRRPSSNSVTDYSRSTTRFHYTTYVLVDVDRLIGERQRLGIRSLQDLSEFHLRFNAISGYLITNQLLSSREQSQCYLRVFDESLQSRIIMRLQIKLPNHHPSLPYTIDEVYDAANIRKVANTLNHLKCLI